MFSTSAMYLESVQLKYKLFENIRIVFYSLVTITCLGIFLRYSLRRRKQTNMYPSPKYSFFDVLGNVKVFMGMAKSKELNLNIYILQLFMAFREMFKNESFYFGTMMYIPFIAITKADAVEDIISGSKHLQKSWIYDWIHPWLGTGLLTSHGKKWKSRRKLLTPAFHFDILKDYLPVINEQSQLLVEILKKHTKDPWIDIVKPITLCSLDIICETTLGVHIGAQNDSESEYVKSVSRAAESIMKRSYHPLYVLDWSYYLCQEGCQFKRDVKLLHDFTRAVIADKKEKLLKNTQEVSQLKKRKSLMDLLLQEHVKNGSMTEEDIREEVDTFAFEGHDTTSMGISWALYLIGLNKDVQKKLLEEIDRLFGDDYERPVTTHDLNDLEYLDRVLKESQRIYPSVPFIGRKLSEDTMICGRKVTKDINILIVSYCIHRDEAVFPNPEKFDPDRFLPDNTVNRSPFAYIPFSAGPRNCIGQRFALMEEKVVIANILRNYTLESLDPRDKILLIPELILRSAGPIRIKLTDRRPSSAH